MKKYFFLPLLFFQLTYGYLPPKRYLMQVNGAYTFPLHNSFRKIYNHAGLINAEASIKAFDNIYPWASVGAMFADGHSLGRGDKTSLTIVPLDIGLKFISNYLFYYPYAAVGASLSWIFIHNDYPYVNQNPSTFDVGLAVKWGLLINPDNSSIFFDIFGRYQYLQANFSEENNPKITTNNPDLSNISAGLGVGYSF